jgi:hypothetical protein
MTMTKKSYLPLLTLGVLASLLLSACGAAAPLSIEPDMYDGEGAPAMEEAAMSPEFAGEFDARGSFDTGGAVAQNVERLVIKDANLSVVVDDPAAELKTISAMAENMGGFVVSSNLFQSFTPTGEEVPSASITIRVPVERLAEALERIEGRANSVTSRTESGQDVTAQYTDLQSRLRNLEDAEELLREIMEEARDTEDVLVAFNQLNSITEQIEVLKGQIQYYEESAALSAINVQLTASAAAQPVTIGSWEPKGVALDAIRALVRALQGIADAAIWLTLYVLPILLVLAIPIWLVWRAVRRRQANRPAAKS